MTEELMKIDRSAIEQLVRIRQDEEVLRERVARAEASKAQVSPVVYQRVSADYRARLDTLLREARPLKDAARGEYAKLRLLEAQYSKALQDVTVDKEELEFRNQLGEFAEGEFAEKMVEFERKVAEQRARVDAAVALKNEFLSAFSSEAELEGPAAPPAAPQAPAAAPAPLPVTPRVAAPVIPIATEPAVPPPTAPMPAVRTVPEDAGEATAATAPAIVHRAIDAQTAPGGEKTTESGFTVLFAVPKLVAIVNGQPAEEYVLAAKTAIGRTSKNDIQILDDSVSRQHCEILLAADGYRVVDLGSHNGVVVNGERVADRLLADGDLVSVGTRQFMFRHG